MFSCFLPLSKTIRYPCVSINSLSFIPLVAVENGETDADAATADTWEDKSEPVDAEAGSGAMEESGTLRDEAQDEMMEEDEEMPTPKLPPPPPDAPKKEHVNVVFIGHVGTFVQLLYTFVVNNFPNVYRSQIKRNIY